MCTWICPAWLGDEELILVSACLAGHKVRYNGSDCLEDQLERLVQTGQAVTVCPELLGGFTTPRPPAEIVGGSGLDVLNGTAKVMDKTGADVSEMYIQGAMRTLEIARELGVKLVVLKEYSPSCGTKQIYNGQFSNERIAGSGVTAALLIKEGIEVMSETAWLELEEV